MRRTPPHEEEDVQQEQDRTRTRRSRPARSFQPEIQPNDDDADGYPESPKIKRASRSAEGAAGPQGNGKRPRLEKPQPVGANTQTLRRRIRARDARTLGDEPTQRRPQPKRRKPLDEDETVRIPLDALLDAPSEEEDRPPRPRRPRVYIEEEPAEPASRQTPKTLVRPQAKNATAQHSYTRVQRREQRAQHALFERIQTLTQNRSLMAGIVGALLFLLLIALIPRLLFPGATTPTIMPINTSSTQQATAMVQPSKPTDPHQLIITPPNNDHPAPPVLATSAYLLDADTGATLYAHNPFMHIPMMSTTKLMTILLVAENDKNLEQPITITPAIANDLNTQLSPDSSVMGVKAGETYTLHEILYGLMLVSGNDAAIVVADTIDGSVPKFVDHMNKRAVQLGLNDTHFRNPHGLLEDNHYSSAHDLAILGQHSLDNPMVHQISSTQNYHIPATSKHAEHYLANGNQFMYWYPGVDDGKTGWDADANFVQVISCTRNHRHLIGVVMHTVDWWTDMRDLINWGTSDFTWLSPREINARGGDSAIPWADAWSYFRSDTRERTIPAENGGRFYVFTEYTVANPILKYFDSHQGLKKFGFPTGPVITTQPTLTQQFEHAKIQCDIQSKQCKTV